MFEVYLLLLGALVVSSNAQIPKQQLPLTKYVSSRVSKPQQSSIDVEFLESTLRALGVEHVVLVAPRTYDMQMSHILTHLLNKSISFELLLENNINMKEYWNTGESVNRTGGNISITNNTSNTTMSTEEINVCYTYTGSEMVDKKLNITCNSFFDSLTFRYMYSSRYRLTRREMIVLVYGPVTWVAQAAAKLLSFKIFGAWDTLLVLPMGGLLDRSWVQEWVPLCTRVVLIQSGNLVQEVGLMDAQLNLRTVAVWRDRNLHLKAPLLPRISTLDGVNFTAVDGGGFVTYGYYSYNSGPEVGGYFGGVVSEIMKSLKANLLVKQVSPSMARGKNGSWEGALGYMERREGDIALAFFGFNFDRAQSVDFTSYLFITGVRFLTHYPFQIENPYVYFSIYHWQVWATIIGSIVGVATVLRLMWNLPDGRNASKSVTRDAFTTTFAATVFQGQDQVPENHAGRLLLAIFWIAAVIIGYSYSGSLTATLSAPTVQRVPTTIQEIQDLKFKVWLQVGFFPWAYMKFSSVGLIKELFKEAEFSLSKSIIPPDDVIYRAHKSSMAIMALEPARTATQFADFGSTSGSRGVCLLKFIEEPLITGAAGFTLPQNSPLTELINRRIMAMHAADLIGEPGKGKKLLPAARFNCLPPPPPSPEPKAFSMNQMVGAFIIWPTGMLLACVAFLVEIVIHKLANQKQPQQNNMNGF